MTRDVTQAQTSTITRDSRIPAFRALYHPNFRLFWCGLVVSHIGSWVQTTGQAWLVYQLTGSSWYLGVVGFSSSLPLLLFLLVGGALADRIERRRLLFFTQSIFMLNALILGTLVATHLVQVWHIIVLSIISGTVMAFDAPTRQSFVQELVGSEDLMNAVALNSAVFNTARILGPALAGILISVKSIGVAGCFFINSASFLAILIALFFMKLNPTPKMDSNGSVWIDMVEGLHYVRRNGTVRMLILMTAIPAIFIFPYTHQMPAFAGKILQVKAQGYGMLMSAVGIGALTGALGLASLSSFPHRGKLLLCAAMLVSIAMLSITFCRSYWVALCILPFLGMAGTVYAATTNSTLQIIAPPHLRGRVLGAYMFAFTGMGPFGNLQMGAVSNHFGVDIGLRTGAVIVGVCTLAVAIFRPDIRRLRL